MEIFAFHDGLKKWIEIGNSGMFRPEMLLPMGLEPNVKVIAWGLSLERPTMIRYGVKNIRDLVGHKCSLEFMRTNPICDLQLDDKYDASAFVQRTEQPAGLLPAAGNSQVLVALIAVVGITLASLVVAFSRGRRSGTGS